jgi:hypothetical protein
MADLGALHHVELRVRDLQRATMAVGLVAQ